MQEPQVQCLKYHEDTLEKEVATHSSILAWEIPRTEEPGGLQSMGSQSQTLLATKQQPQIVDLQCCPLARSGKKVFQESASRAWE